MSGVAGPTVRYPRLHCAASFTRERIGFRTPKLSFVWYPRRGFIEAWCGRFGALRHDGQWLFTSTGQFVIGLGPLRQESHP